jgi:hypothetical protein
VTTSAASSVTVTSAILKGLVAPNRLETNYRFDYGTSPRYGSSTSSSPVGSTSGDHLESEVVSGLEPNTTYHFRVLASNAAGTAYGQDHTFTTLATRPLVTTQDATNITATGATFRAIINPQNQGSTYFFQYGVTAGYGSRAPASGARIRSTRSSESLFRSTMSLVPTTLYQVRVVHGQSVAAVVSGLVPNRLYHFRVVASNPAGTSYGDDQTLRTLAPKPATSTSVASAITGNGATLTGTVNPENQAAKYHFEYGTTTGYGSRVPARDAAAGRDYSVHTVREAVSGLSPHNTYHYRLVATNGAGTTYGNDHTFRTRSSSVDRISATAEPFAAIEGQALTNITVARFTEPDTSALPSEYSARIDWGDATPQSVGTITGGVGSFSIAGSHTYREEGSYTITVRISDSHDIANTAEATAAVSVYDAALHASDATPPAAPQSFNGRVATFTDDAGTASSTKEFSATIDWGDGSPASAGTIDAAGSSYEVSGSHTYNDTGHLTIKVHIVDDGGSAADASGTLLIFGAAPHGSFVIGDGSAAIGHAVTFWGANWSNLNSLSAGEAPSSFRGFEDSVGPPYCGATWTAEPGNGATPPAGPLPTYMAVIVSSSISQSGALITGDSPHLAIVQTDPGYAPDPGHAGTGEFISLIC